MERTIIIDNKIEQKLKNILEYMRESEKRHYEECSQKDKVKHIFRDVVALEKWIKEQSEEN